MDPTSYEENNRNMQLCLEAEQMLRTFNGSAAQLQKLVESDVLINAHDALEYIWDVALVGTNAPQVAWDECRKSIKHTVDLFDTMAQRLDEGKLDLSEFKSPENCHQLLLALKTLEVRVLQLKPFDGSKDHQINQAALEQLINMLNAAINLIKTTYVLLKA